LLAIRGSFRLDATIQDERLTPGAMANLEIDASETAPREGLSLDFSFVVSGIWPLLIAGFVLRIILGAIHGTAFTIDTGTFEAWSFRLADKGPWNFYSEDYFSDYAPGYLYVLFLIGKLNTIFEFSKHEFQFIFKLPSIFADIGIAYLLWRFLEGQRSEVRLGAAALYLFFPPAILMGAVWGQVDALSVFFLMLSIYWISRDRPAEGAVAYVVGFIIKPQIIAALPFLAFWIMRRHPPRWSAPGPHAWQWLAGWLLLGAGALVGVAAYAVDPDKYGAIAAAGGIAFLAGAALLAYLAYSGYRDPENGAGKAHSGILLPPLTWLRVVGAGSAALLLLAFPFFPDYPWEFITQLKDATDVENYRVGSFWAYNFWGMWGFFKPDNVDSCLANPACTSAEFLGVEYQYWGIFLFAINTVLVIYVLRNAEGDWALALGTALCLLAFYIFLTRMHERYMFPFFVPFLAACVLSRSPLLWTAFVVLALMQFLNLYQVYAYYQPNELRIDDIYQYFEKAEVFGTGWQLSRILSLITFIGFPVTLIGAYLLANPLRRSEAT
jgi:hypothetical protein